MVQAIWISLRIDFSLQLRLTKPPSKSPINLTKSLKASEQLYDLCGTADYWSYGRKKIILKLQQMIQQSLYIIHGDLTGMCWGRGGGRFKIKDYQQDVSAGFTISIYIKTEC